jgi:hypothetical protein
MTTPPRLKFRITLPWFITWFIMVSSFTIVGFLLVTKAMGYRYNMPVGRWQKTGMVIVSADPRSSKLRLDGQSYLITQDTRIPHLLPGKYRLQVSKTGYQPWMETVIIDPGYVAHLETVSLFLEEPIPAATSERAIELLANPPVNDTVRITEGEIWYRTQFVSRFVTPPSNAVLYSTGKHVLYALGKQIRITEINGSHDFLLYERTNDNATPLVEVDDKTIAFLDGETPIVAQIR